MQDARTLQAYDDHAAAYSADWLAQPAPDDLYALLTKHFIAGGRTADIGCGNGRDANWLAAHGFPVEGFDASEALLAEARRLFPAIPFRHALLPDLTGVTAPFDNIVCETVIMHLSPAAIPAALASLQRILRPGGVIYLSWRATEGEDQRHADGRLYAAFRPDLVRAAFAGWAILHDEDVTSLSSGKRICRLIARKPAA